MIKKARVLIADDEEIIIELVRDTLEADGYEVVSACNGKEALEKVYKEHPDVILLDIKMPEMDGFEVCEKIRQDVLLRNLPILMLTVKKTEESEVRGLQLGVDDYLTKPFRPAILKARIESALSRVRQGLNVNPLTYLPGNTIIAKEIESRLQAGKDDFAVLYIDLDSFKAYNDYYGFHKGDEIIKTTARVILNAVNSESPEENFVGHIGGDDFIAVINHEKIQKVCEKIVKEFDNKILSYYDIEDRQKGFIEIENRKGEPEKFPMVSVSIAVVTVKDRNYSHIGEISKVGTELKKFAKKESKSNYVIDRRKR